MDKRVRELVVSLKLTDAEMKCLRPDVPNCQQMLFGCDACSADCRLTAKAQLRKVLTNPDFVLRDKTKPVKYDLATNTNYIAIIPLEKALKEVA